MMKLSQRRFVGPFVIAVCLAAPIWDDGARLSGAPNLVANGDLEQPRARATPRPGATENDVIFEFPGEMSFGRVIASGRGAGALLAEQLGVGYVAQGGNNRGLMVDAREVKLKVDYDIAIWFDLRGKIRPNKQYAYSVQCSRADQGDVNLRMIAPAIWADGKFTGATVDLAWTDEDETYDDISKRGVVKSPDFQYQTGGQSLILKLPKNYKGVLFVVSVSLREIDDSLLKGEAPVMPTPIRYIAMNDLLEDRIEEVFDRTADALKGGLGPQGFWRSSGDLDTSVELTATVLDALAGRGESLTSTRIKASIDWLVEQEVDSVHPISERLTFLSRYQVEEHRKRIAADLLKLIDAQHEDGGWSDSAAKDAKNDRTKRANNNATTTVVMALREAHYAGFKADVRMWYKAGGFFREAQARDGGFRATLDQYGGLGEATTTHMTCLGLTGMLATLDMGFAVSSPRCDQYLTSTEHIKKMNLASDWLAKYYDEQSKRLATLDTEVDPFFHALVFGDLMELSGVTHLHDKNVFRTEAERVFGSGGRQFFDSGSGLFLGSLQASAAALSFLTNGAAPVAFQRCVVGGARENLYSRDGDHLVRYLRSKREKPVNWRDVDLDRPIGDLITSPILYVNVVGPMDFEETHWRHLRDYCFGGGVVLINVAEGSESERAAVEAGLKIAFPEYTLKDLPADDAVLSIKHEMKSVAGVRVIHNGLKNLVFLTPEDWSCRLNSYEIEEHPETFQFIDNVLTYTLDSGAPRSSFLPSTWIDGTASAMSIDAAYLQVGAELPALPDMMMALDRGMRSEYRLKVNQTPQVGGAKPDLLWLACAGETPMTDEQRGLVEARINDGAFLFAEVISGNTSWAELFRADLQKLGGEIRIRKLLSNHPILNGQFNETYGHDVRVVKLRKALHEEFKKLPRVDMYVIERDDKEIGVLSVHDVGSGLGYIEYPGCRGVMPRDSRRLAANVVLYAMQRALP